MSKANPRFRRFNAALPLVGLTQGVVLYRIWGSLENQLTITTFYFLGPVNQPTQTQLTTLLTNIANTMFGVYSNCISLDWTCTKETLDVVHVNSITGVVNTSHANSSGARTTGHLPTEVCGSIIRYSAIKGQHGRGRISVPGVATADVSSSKITAAAAVSAYNTLAADLGASFSDGTNSWVGCIVQRQPSSPHLVQGASAVIRTVFNPLLGTVRRRKIGRGK